MEIDFTDKNDKLPVPATYRNSMFTINTLSWDANTLLIRTSLDVYDNLKCWPLLSFEFIKVQNFALLSPKGFTPVNCVYGDFHRTYSLYIFGLLPWTSYVSLLMKQVWRGLKQDIVSQLSSPTKPKGFLLYNRSRKIFSVYLLLTKTLRERALKEK